MTDSPSPQQASSRRRTRTLTADLTDVIQEFTNYPPGLVEPKLPNTTFCIPPLGLKLHTAADVQDYVDEILAMDKITHFHFSGNSIGRREGISEFPVPNFLSVGRFKRIWVPI